jgi:hypothetical protein
VKTIHEKTNLFKQHAHSFFFFESANLTEDETNEDLKNFFSKYGVVENVRVIFDRKTGRSKRYAFVEMKNVEDGEAALRDIPKTSTLSLSSHS